MVQYTVLTGLGQQLVTSLADITADIFVATTTALSHYTYTHISYNCKFSLAIGCIYSVHTHNTTLFDSLTHDTKPTSLTL